MDTLKHLIRINSELFNVYKWLNEENRDLESSSRVILLLGELTKFCRKQNKLQDQKYGD